MSHLTLQDVQASQIGELVVPSHCGHSRGGTVSLKSSGRDLVPRSVMIVHNVGFLGFRYLQQMTVFWTRVVELLQKKLQICI